MSLYGNVRRIGSQQFQFDRIYPSRVAMDEANSTRSDGVHVGRYVLIEYGQRYDSEKDENGNIVQTYRNEFDPATGTLNKVPYPKWIERDEFKQRRTDDFNAYGMNYDSTVWQKIYSNNTEKYIMIAELNAILPKLDINVEGSLIYSEANEENPADEVYDAFNNQVDNVNVEINKPYFDHIQDTEMAYLLHFPQPIQLNVDAESIDYNAAGFNVFYDSPKDPTLSYIRWITDDFYGYNYDANGHVTENTGDIVYPKTDLTALLNSRTLRMHIPAFGNAISDLYDMLYGHASYERDPVTNEVIYLPYIDPLTGKEDPSKHGEPQLAYYRTSKGYLMDVHGHVLRPEPDVYPEAFKAGKNPKKYVIVNDNGNPIDADGNEIARNADGGYSQALQYCTGELVLDALRPYFKQYRDKYPYIMDLTTVPPVETDTVRNPLNDMNDDMYWKKDVPGIDKILANNSAGLAAILTELFGVKNPLTGEIKYWLLNDWTSEEYNEEGNTPTLRNKPEIVTYTTKTEYQDLEELFNTQEAAHSINSRYPTDRKRWLRGVNVKDPNTKIPVIDINTNKEITSANQKVGYTEDYSYYKVEKNNDGSVLEDGHWYLDLDGWSLRRVFTNLPDNLESATLKLKPKKLAPVLNNTTANTNNNQVTTVTTNKDMMIYGDLSTLASFTYNGQDKKWIYLDIETNVKDLTTLTINQEPIPIEHLEYGTSVGIPDGHFLFVVAAEEIAEDPITIVVTKSNGVSEELSFMFIDQ